MAREYSNNPEKFKLCKYCGSENTRELLSKDDGIINKYTYFGWCCDCLSTYNYNFQVDTVQDKEGRI